MPTSCSPAIASSRASRWVTSRCSITASTSWLPTESTGLSDVIGSWKIIEISLPRSARSRRFDASSRFSPRNSACPVETDVCFFDAWRNASMRGLGRQRRDHARCAPGFGFRLRIDIIVTLFPEPDSPTTPSVWPGLDRERDAVDRLHDPVVRLEVRPQVAHVEERGLVQAGRHASRILGSIHA